MPFQGRPSLLPQNVCFRLGTTVALVHYRRTRARLNTACAGCGPWCCAHLHAAHFLRTCTWPRASVLPWKPFTWAAVGHRLWIVVLSRQKAPAPYKVSSTKDGDSALLMHNYPTGTNSRSLSCIHHAGYHQEQELFIQTWKGCYARTRRGWCLKYLSHCCIS